MALARLCKYSQFQPDAPRALAICCAIASGSAGPSHAGLLSGLWLATYVMALLTTGTLAQSDVKTLRYRRRLYCCSRHSMYCMSCQHSCEVGECWATLARLNTTMTVQASKYNGSLQSDAAHAHVCVLQRRQICMIQMMFEQGPSMPAVSPAAPAGCLQVERLCPMSCFQVNTPRSLSCLVPPVCLCGRYRPGEILASSPLCIHTQPDHVQSLRAVFCFAYNLVSSNGEAALISMNAGSSGTSS